MRSRCCLTYALLTVVTSSCRVFARLRGRETQRSAACQPALVRAHTVAPRVDSDVGSKRNRQWEVKLADKEVKTGELRRRSERLLLPALALAEAPAAGRLRPGRRMRCDVGGRTPRAAVACRIGALAGPTARRFHTSLSWLIPL